MDGHLIQTNARTATNQIMANLDDRSGIYDGIEDDIIEEIREDIYKIILWQFENGE